MSHAKPLGASRIYSGYGFRATRDRGKLSTRWVHLGLARLNTGAKLPYLYDKQMFIVIVLLTI